jgi:rubredoxin
MENENLSTSARYQCDTCGYIYDPAKGDPENNVKPCAFADLPESWVCPICGGAKGQFTKIS